jgi:hypothetical protein
MLGRCPLKNTQEWKDLVDKYNGNEQRAREEWDLRHSDDDAYYTIENDETWDFAEDEEPQPHSFEKALDKVRVFLKERLLELSKKKIKNQKAEAAKRRLLQKQIEELDGVDAINAFIDDAFETSVAAEKTYKEIINKYNKGEITSKDFLASLVDLNDFANAYSILDEIAKEDVRQYFSAPSNKPISKYTPQDKIATAIAIRNQIKTVFVQEAIPILAETLVNYRNNKSNTTIQEQIKKFERQIQEIKDSDAPTQAKLKSVAFAEKELETWQNMLLDKQRMEGILKSAVKDESIFDYLLNPLISSDDSALALFAKMVKSRFEIARMEDIDERNEAVDILKAFTQKTGRGVNNVEELNKDIYETISVVKRDANGRAEKENGEVLFETKMSFVQKYDLNKFALAQKEFYTNNPRPKLKEDPSQIETKEYNDALKLWYKKRDAWYARNTKAKSKDEINKIIADKQSDLEKGYITTKEYDEWIKSRISEDPLTKVKIYKKELAEPIDAYLSEKWKKLYDSEGNPISPQGEYHKYLTDLYFKGQELIPESQRLGYILPSIPMEEWERLQRRGPRSVIKTKFEDLTRITARDQELYGQDPLLTRAQAKQKRKEKLSKEEEDALFQEQKERLDPSRYQMPSLSGENLSSLPVYYSQNMDADDVSVDLISSVLRYNSMARRYDQMNRLHAEISAFKTVIGERKIPVTNSKGEPIFNIVAKRLGHEQFIKQEGQSRSEKHVNDFIDMVVLGEMQAAETLFGLEISKLTNTATGFSAITTIAADVLKGVANNIQGNIQVLIEAAGGEFFSIKNWALGQAQYSKYVGDAILDFGRLRPESFLGQLTEIYDPIQGTFKDEYGKNVSASIANKLFRTNTLFFNQNFAEHQIQVSTMLALMNATKVINKKDGKEMTLTEAHELYGPFLFDVKQDVNGNKYKEYKVAVKIKDAEGNEETVDFDEKQRQEFMNTLHALNKRMHGVYNDFDKATAQKYSLGRLLMMYRKHLYPAYKRRYKKASFDEELGAPTEGIYRVFWRTMIKDMKVYKLNISKRWNNMTPFEKAQVKKVLAEQAIILSLFALILALTALGGDDEEKKKKDMPYAYYFVLYEAIRMRSETVSYLPIIGTRDLLRTVKSPSPVLGTIDRFIKFMDQFLLTWDPDKLSYKRETGVWNKGDNKTWAYFLRLMGYSGYNLTPEEAIKSFQSTFSK